MTNFEKWRLAHNAKIAEDREKNYDMDRARRIAKDLKNHDWLPDLQKQLCQIAGLNPANFFDLESATMQAATLLDVDIY